MNGKYKIGIALIDDHDLLRHGIFQFLGDFGFQKIFEASNGQEALRKMEECEMLPDICIVDVNMPVMDGFETCLVLRENYPNVKLLAFCENDEEDVVRKMLQCGVSGYVLKGADPEELRIAIETLFKNGKYFSPGVSKTVQDFLKGSA